MEAEVSAANRELDEFKVENEGLRREAESREALLKEKSIEAENLRLELTAVKNDAEMKKEIARVSQEGSERALAATRDQAETAERAARELAGNFAVERLEHARLQTELRQEFRNTSDRQTAVIDQIRLDLAQSVTSSKELENHLGAARAMSESLSREIDRLKGEVTQLKADWSQHALGWRHRIANCVRLLALFIPQRSKVPDCEQLSAQKKRRFRWR